MDKKLLSKLCETQAENERMVRAIREFKNKREALDNSQSDALAHQSKRIQQRRKELEQAKQKLYSFLQ